MLLGTVGLSAGSWYGGRGAIPLSHDQTESIAAELLPDAEVTGGVMIARGYRYGTFLADDDFGSIHAEFQYGDRANCPLSDQLRHNAAARGWQGLSRLPNAPCDGLRITRDGLTATLTHGTNGSRLSIAPSAPDGYLATTVAGTLLGAAAGAALFWLGVRRRRPVPILVVALVAVGLFPGVALTWSDLTDGLAEPVWPIWPALAPVLVPMWLVVLLAGFIVFARRRNAASARDANEVRTTETV
ncbi:hypothetical protein ABZ780_06230 [Micromonospora sp. NPDC047467]|uniref:hypothetical protein n=1 Tax=Micromonospora sp. NPDC047467 TaxID=3154814 RepID=UPI0033F674C4